MAACWLLFQYHTAQATTLVLSGHYQYNHTPDTVPKYSKGLFKRISEYRDSLRNKAYRDSLIRKVTRQDILERPDDSAIIKSEAYFTPFSGKVIRDIYYRQVKVFGPRNINDTTFTTSMKLIHLANRLHFDSKNWVIKQSLFFKENDTLQPYELADNERYLRNRPFLQDARLYIINASASPDSVDILVVTKDVFEYGGDIGQLSPTNIDGRIFSNNLLGAGQGLQLGFSWRNDYNPAFRPEIKYTKYNIGGSNIDVTGGYSALNNYFPLDTNVYEGSYYVTFSRPLYRASSRFVGGLTLASNFSMNARQVPDTVYRDYRYSVVDAWVGFNFFNQYKLKDPASKRPNLALLIRHYNLAFQKQPTQKIYEKDPVYNDHRYYLAQLVAFRQDFFKARHFFGFGRTEDIPLGYTISASTGWETWTGRRRMYSALEAQKFWTTDRQALINASVGLSSFWQNNSSEDAVIHAHVEYYSRLFTFKKARLRQFATIDYLGNPNNYFYKKLNINMENGVWGYRNTLLNGYQRLNVRTETVYYSPLKLLGFKFNFFSALQLSQITSQSDNLLNNPLYTGIGLGFRVRNENLSLNTLKISGNYYPNAPAPMKGFIFEITTIVDFRFDISALKAPSFLQFW